jgi:hypothetical protein
MFRSIVFEGINDDNNTGSAPIPVTYREPDLRVTNLTVPEAASSGQTIPVTWTVTNVGTRETREFFWMDRVYLSLDPSLDESDQQLGAFERIGTLRVGQSYATTLNVALPDGVEGGFYLLGFADSNISGWPPPSPPHVGFESDVNPYLARVGEYRDEGNNVTVAPLSISLSPPPDLQVTSVVHPERVLVGQEFDLTYTVTNNGNGPTPAKQNSWEDLIYLSRDPFLDLQADRYLNHEWHVGQLAAGGSYTKTVRLRAPRDLTGPFYAFVVTDPVRYANMPDGNVFEGDRERNNDASGVQQMIIELPPPSDLQVDTIVASSSAAFFSSINPSGSALMKTTMSGRRVSWLPVRSTSNSTVTWKTLLRGFSQSM